MIREDLYHWQDSPEEIEKSNAAFAKFESAGLLEELEFIIEKRMSNARSDESYNNTDFSG